MNKYTYCECGHWYLEHINDDNCMYCECNKFKQEQENE
jgi:hypothetical protein